MSKFNFGFLQQLVTRNKEANYRNVTEGIAKCMQKADINVFSLGESWLCPYTGRDFRKNAEVFDSNSPTLNFLSDVAAKNNIYLIGGTFPEIDKETGKIYNTCACFDKSGEYVGKFRKMHLFDVSLPNYEYKESKMVSPGEDLFVFETEYCKIGIGVCYDLRFPELATLYTTKYGCEMLVYPSTFTNYTGPLHWSNLLISRSLDNLAYVAGISPARDENSKFVCYAHSAVCDPWGKIVTELGKDPDVGYAEIDLDFVRKCRQKLPILEQRATNAYNLSEVKK